LLIAVVTAATISTACGDGAERVAPSEADGVRIASFDFDESRLVAEVYAQALELVGLDVVRLGSIGPREVIAPALEQGLIDLVPEYLGTASKHFGATSTDRAGLSAALARRELVALEPAPAQDVNVFVVTEETAAALGLVHISDLSGSAAGLRIGGPVECPGRPLCLEGLQTRYGLDFAEFVPQRSLAVTAEALRRNEIDVGVLFSSAPEVSEGPFVVLDDDRRLQPPENIVPLVRQAALDRWGPTLERALDRLSRRLTTSALRSMNAAVGDGDSVETAAAAWLNAVTRSGG
jgi:osmoprotectant transport system substrate-binding protein